MFSEIKIAIKILSTVSDGVMLWRRMFVRKKLVCLLHCLDVSIMKKSCLLALSLRLLFVIQPGISLRQSPSCLREISVSAVDKDLYTWVLSAYKWRAYLWLCIRQLSGVIYRVNSSGLRMALPLKIIFLFLWLKPIY